MRRSKEIRRVTLSLILRQYREVMHLSGLLLLLLFWVSSSPAAGHPDQERSAVQSPVGSILLIKNMVNQMFVWYKSELQSFREMLDSTRLSVLEVSERLQRLEVVLRGLREPAEDQEEANGRFGFGNDLQRGSEHRVKPGLVPRAAVPPGWNSDVPEHLEMLWKLERLSRVYAPRTCYELREMGVDVSGKYYLDPDGPGMGSKPMEFFCDMKTGTTRVDHELSEENEVSLCQEAGCSVHRVQYRATLAHIKAITGLSQKCEQQIKFSCLGWSLNMGNESLSWWKDRSDVVHHHWAADLSSWNSKFVASRDSGPPRGCQCALTGNCLDSSGLCNCDAGNASQVWLHDEGRLTDKDILPVTQLNFGLLQHTNDQQKPSARFRLGPLLCSGFEPGQEGGGTKSSGITPKSCHDLWLRGHTQVGYYIVKSRQEKFPRLVFCDMTRSTVAPSPASAAFARSGFQRSFGSPGNLRHFVAFDVSLSHSLYDDFRYVNFSRSNVDHGANFNLRDGIFRAPVSGVYLLTLHAMPVNGQPFRMQVHVNGNAVASVSNGQAKTDGMVGQTLVVDLATGDQVRLFNFGGKIHEDSDPSTQDFMHFTGVLVYANDRDTF